jgi:hypothetical protein
MVPFKGHRARRPSDFMWPISGSMALRRLRSAISRGVSAKKGRAGLRREARRRLVGVVRWRMGSTGMTREKTWFDLMGNEASKATLDDWQKEVGGESGKLCRDAFAAGKVGDTAVPWSASNSDLVEIIELANSGPGKRKLALPRLPSL